MIGTQKITSTDPLSKLTFQINELVNIQLLISDLSTDIENSPN